MHYFPYFSYYIPQSKTWLGPKRVDGWDSLEWKKYYAGCLQTNTEWTSVVISLSWQIGMSFVYFVQQFAHCNANDRQPSRPLLNCHCFCHVPSQFRITVIYTFCVTDWPVWCTCLTFCENCFSVTLLSPHKRRRPWVRTHELETTDFANTLSVKEYSMNLNNWNQIQNSPFNSYCYSKLKYSLM